MAPTVPTRNAAVKNYTRPASNAGAKIIAGGTRTSIAGMINRTGTITTTTTKPKNGDRRRAAGDPLSVDRGIVIAPTT